jgi:TonB family protein
MAAVAKIDQGVVELRTDVGRLYVCPSQWQRVYLRWTFRNFHILPQQVLNRRQKRLIEVLSRTALVTSGEAIPASAIIGVVEGVRVFSLPSKAEMPETASPAKIAVPQAKLTVLRGSAQSAEVELGRPAELPPLAPAKPADPITRNSVEFTDGPEEAEPLTPTREIAAGHSTKMWTVGAAVAVVALVALGYQLAPLWRVPRLEIAQPAVAPAPVVAAKNTGPAALPAVAKQAGQQANRVGAEAKPAPPEAQPRLGYAASKGTAKATAAPVAAAGAYVSIAERLPQIAEAPQSGFTYPVAPNPNLVGKVVLKAVIGSDGAVKQVEVLSGDRALAAAATRAVRHWRYAPAQVDGRAAEAQTQVTVSFLGDDAVSIILPSSR